MWQAVATSAGAIIGNVAGNLFGQQPTDNLTPPEPDKTSLYITVIGIIVLLIIIVLIIRKK